MPIVVDQLDRQIEIPEKLISIVSLVPSQTELLFYLGLQQFIKGVTKFCIHPAAAKKNCRVIGGTKSIHFDRIEALKPDIIFGNKEENTEEMIVSLSKKYPVWLSDIKNARDAFDMIHSISTITRKAEKGAELVESIKERWSHLTNKYEGIRVLYLIWQRPYMAVGTETYIHYVLDKLGFTNVIQTPRYPELNENDLNTLRPELILLSSEPYPFKEKHLNQIKQVFPTATVKLVDGEMFSWYGPRMLRAADYFSKLEINLEP